MVLVSQAPVLVKDGGQEREDGLTRLIRQKLIETQAAMTGLDHKSDPDQVCKATVRWLKELVFNAQGKAYVTYVNWLCWHAVRTIQRTLRSQTRQSAATIQNAQLDLPGWGELTRWTAKLPDGTALPVAYMTRAQILWVASQYAAAARENSVKELYLSKVAEEMLRRKLAADATVEALYQLLGKAS